MTPNDRRKASAGAGLAHVPDLETLEVEPRAVAVDDNPEFAYGVWRTLSWLLGVREDFPIYTSWHRAADLPRDRPHLYAPLRGGEPDAAWFAAEQAAQDQARTDALHYWQHVRARVDAAMDVHIAAMEALLLTSLRER